jgi:hypothetical protein
MLGSLSLVCPRQSDSNKYPDVVLEWDYINFLPSALAELPKMLGLEELKKGYFPHLFNRKENQSVVLNHLPDVHYYNPDAMIHCMALMECFSSWRYHWAGMIPMVSGHRNFVIKTKLQAEAIVVLCWKGSMSLCPSADVMSKNSCYFPHLFNRKENQSVVLNHLPDVHYYNPDAMKLKDRKVFFVWYETNYRQRFDFQRELLSYCSSEIMR